MSRQISFAIVLHFHQPVGNFDEVFHRAYNNCYIKILEMLQKYPQIKMSMHFSGSLLSWIEKNHPEFFNIIRKLVEINQIEIISGGFYEPILPAISEKDAIAQIRMLNNYISKNFKMRPSGAWIAERVWEPYLASTLSKAGIKYAILDDTHFTRAGFKKNNTYGYYIAKDASKAVAVFPSDKELRYRIPFKKVSATIDYIKKASHNKKNILFCYADDAEKFGEWPDTYKRVYENGWLDNFFKTLIDNSYWLKTITLKQAIKRHSPLAKLRLGAASYVEMLKWSGGSWWNFLNKYYESNQMHKKMRHLSRRIATLEKKPANKKTKKLLKLATGHLYRSQSSCPYWHGIFGGLYLFNLRNAVYQNLIKAESILDSLRHREPLKGEAIGSRPEAAPTLLEVIDYNQDGHKEIIFSNKLIAAYFSPNDGGSLLELDYRPLAMNLINIVSRKKEPYHRNIKKADIIYDSYKKYCLLDHIISAQSTYQQFIRGSLREIDDFINKKYSYKVENTKDGNIIVMRAASSSISIQKKIFLYNKNAEIKIEYLIKNTSSKALDVIFGTEFNIIAPDGNPPLAPTVNTQLASASDINIKNKESNMNLQFRIKPDSRVWMYPINTISRSEKEYKYNYQGTSMLFSWPLKLKPGDMKTLKIGTEIGTDT